MKQYKSVPYLILIGLLVIGLAAPVAAVGNQQVIGQPGLSVSVADNEVSPGQETTVEFNILNRGSIRQSGPKEYTDRVTTARAVSIDTGNADSPLSVNTKSISPGNIPTGSSGPHQISVTVPENTKPGMYDIPLQITYEYTLIVNYGDGQTEFVDRTKTQEVDITLQVENQAQFEVVDTAATVPINGDSEIAVTVENTGSEPASDISLTASSPSSELAIGGSSASTTGYIAQLNPDEQQTVTYLGELTADAPSRNYIINLDTEYSDTDGLTRTAEPMQLGVGASPEQSFSLSNADTTLQAGKDGDLTMAITNTGPQRVENLVLNWQSDHSNLSPQETQYAIGTLEIGESVTAKFGVDIARNAEAGQKQFQFTTAYEESDGDRRESDPISLQAPIEEQSDTIKLTSSETTINSGETRVINLKLENNGNERLTDISAALFADSPISTADDEAFVSALNPGESTMLTFSISAEGGALNKTYPISLDFQYEESDGDTLMSDTYRVPIQISTVSSEGGIPLGQISIGLFLILLAVGGYAWFRK